MDRQRKASKLTGMAQPAASSTIIAVIALVTVRKHEALAFTGCMACPSCLLFLTKDQMGSGRQGKDAWTC
jgi:hypothetical protein